VKCPKCDSLIELDIVRIDSGISPRRSQLHTYKCPKCQFELEKWRDTPEFKESIKRSLRRFSADLGEHMAAKILRDKGFLIWSFSDFLSEMSGYERESASPNGIFWNRVLKPFFVDKKNLQKLISYCKAWTEDPDVPSGKKIDRSRSGRPSNSLYPNKYWVHLARNFGPDWIARKNGRFYIVEVKTNKAVLQRFQRKMLLKAKEFGLIPLLVRIRVSIDVPLKEVRVEEF